MTDPRHDVTESCIEALSSGADIQQLIAMNPELRPVLEAAAQANQLDITDTAEDMDAQHRSRTRVLAHAAQQRATTTSPWGIFIRLPRFALATFIALFAFFTWSSLLIASARSLPGDQLYPVKRAVENLRLNLSSSPDTFQHIEEQYRERRIDEIRELLAEQRSELVSFNGIVNELGKRHWIVDNIPVIVAPETVILGQIEIGMRVEVEGYTQTEGWVRASEIHLQEFEILGIVEELNNQKLVIAGQEIKIDTSIEVDPQIQIGAQVIVVVQANDDGILLAVDIILMNLAPSVTPVTTATPRVPPTQTENLSPTNTLDLDDDEVIEGEEDENEPESDSEKNNDDEEDESQEKDDESEEDEEQKDETDEEEGRKDD